MLWFKTKDNILPDDNRWVIVSKNGHTQVIPHHYDVKNDRWWWYPTGEEQFDIQAWCDYPIAPKTTLIWQYATRQEPDLWKDATDEEYELGKHLAKWNWRQVEK